MKSYHNWIKVMIIMVWSSVDLNAQSPDTISHANYFFHDHKWEKAFDLYTKITSENPYNGIYWYRLGLIEKHRDNYKESIESLKRAIECGSDLAESNYTIGVNYAFLGDMDKALIHLKLAIGHGLNNRENRLLSDKELDPLRSLASFKKLVIPDTTGTIARLDQWNEDIQFLKSQVELTHYRLYDYYPKSKWDTDFETLIDRVAQLKDYEVIVRLMKVMNEIGIGHSYIMPPFSGKNQFHQIPIELYEFSDGIFIKQTLPSYKSLLGKKITSINGIPIEKILEMASTVAIAENKIMKRRSSLFYATLPEILMAFGLATDHNKSVIGYLDQYGNETRMSVVHQAFSPDSFLTRKTNEGWVSMDESINPPLFLSRLDNKYWFTYLSDSQIVYCQINEIGNEKEKSFHEFGEDLLRFIDYNEVKALVLDLRFNLGGSGKLNKDFLRSIIKSDKINEPGKLFTIIGNMTFSAAMLLSTQLDQYTETTFIGEPSGGKPSHVGDDNEISLPHSGLKAYASKSFWQSPVPYDERNWIAPEIYIQPSSKEWKQGFDPCLEYVVKIITRGNSFRH
ncbi:hypothetical protein AB9K32_02165 [Allomuricauda sp. XS_ASV26]|uniref:hypothetical protein n=1 Tax=Allomuricauda sp. XS_ASV26 TaxID=3241292 RepID=UPI003517327B